mmetsp:Transcript_284/g.1107  ORF Transcript_284/g.1107 Transcript_284/m.1107 type:complete len:257 (+) Transcript_284:740-1510(+)
MRSLAVRQRVLAVRRELDVPRHVVVLHVDLVKVGLLGVGGVTKGPQVGVPQQLAVPRGLHVGGHLGDVEVVPLAHLDDVKVAVPIAVGPILSDPLSQPVDVRDAVRVDRAAAHREGGDDDVLPLARDGLGGVHHHDPAAALVRENVAPVPALALLVAGLHVDRVAPHHRPELGGDRHARDDLHGRGVHEVHGGPRAIPARGRARGVVRRAVAVRQGDEETLGLRVALVSVLHGRHQDGGAQEAGRRDQHRSRNRHD